MCSTNVPVKPARSLVDQNVGSRAEGSSMSFYAYSYIQLGLAVTILTFHHTTTALSPGQLESENEPVIRNWAAPVKFNLPLPAPAKSKITAMGGQNKSEKAETPLETPLFYSRTLNYGKLMRNHLLYFNYKRSINMSMKG